jgi:ferrous iron transport protein B
MRKQNKILVAVAGQPNSGKSTIFNLLTGARQHVANYPGVTVEKKIGSYKFKKERIELVDLPGTYSLTSYTLDERIARDFLLKDRPNVVVDIVDASNLERNLYLAFQLKEMGIPLVIDLNMVDIAKRRGFGIDIDELSQQLDSPVIPTVGNRGRGKRELREAIRASSQRAKASLFRLDYEQPLESILSSLEKSLSGNEGILERYPCRWLAVKLIENDSGAQGMVRKNSPNPDAILNMVAQMREEFISQYKEAPEKVIARQRYRAASEIVERCLKRRRSEHRTLTDKIDMIICNRFIGPIILLGTIYVIYDLSIVQGYRVTNYTWPLIAWARDFLASLLPSEGFAFDPFWRAMPLGVIDGIVAVINYVPIFAILFTLIAIMEDTGYISRMAFILDRVFRYFGLHGRSVLPLVLGGVFVGGCAIPGVMACRGIKDEKARLATILIVPLMNCLAKIPLYTLLLGLFFVRQKAIMMFFIATITIIIALGVAKVFSLTILKRRESTPFILEMPAYHIPTVGGVGRRMLERLGMFFKKIVTVVAIVMILVFTLMHSPGLKKERVSYYNKKATKATGAFYKEIGKGNSYTELLAKDKLMEFIDYWSNYKKAIMGAKSKQAKEALRQTFAQENSEFFKVVNRGRGLDKKIDKNAKKIFSAYKKLDKKRARLRAAIKEETIRESVMGRIGRSLESVSKWLGFNWKVNIALISCFAAKENSVGVIGGIYQLPMGGEKAEKKLKEGERGWTPLHALAMILFMALYPPCIPTLLMIQLEAGTKWMLLATIYPIFLGGILAFLAFSGGNLLGLSGLQAMIVIYVLAIAFMTIMGFIKPRAKLTIERR